MQSDTDPLIIAPQPAQWNVRRWREVRIANRRHGSPASRERDEARRLISADPDGTQPRALIYALAALAFDYARRTERGRPRDLGRVIANALDNALDGAGIPPARPVPRTIPPPAWRPLSAQEAADVCARIVAATQHLRPESVVAAVAERIGIFAAQQMSDEQGRDGMTKMILGRADRIAREWQDRERRPLTAPQHRRAQGIA
jgi:hypothetical protein